MREFAARTPLTVITDSLPAITALAEEPGVSLSTTAVTRGRCCHTSPETVQVKRAMMAASARTVLPADHTKLTRDGMYALTSLRDFDLLVVDEGLPEREVRALRGMGTEVLVVPARGDGLTYRGFRTGAQVVDRRSIRLDAAAREVRRTTSANTPRSVPYLP